MQTKADKGEGSVTFCKTSFMDDLSRQVRIFSLDSTFCRDTDYVDCVVTSESVVCVCVCVCVTCSCCLCPQSLLFKNAIIRCKLRIN